ncbi:MULTISPECIES: hypothetical protein [unclassified Xanthomonas]|uniref:hypothetical protein n=1 Tax=unclassified Xanthomonas TaxID=2643310 RepID=UPI00136D6963|nr:MULTISPECIES: hypothetical protein [unclassified Xanthomonas]MBB5943510.1 hypothetical protein [Xanthomonas sp. 3307]
MNLTPFFHPVLPAGLVSLKRILLTRMPSNWKWPSTFHLGLLRPRFALAVLLVWIPGLSFAGYLDSRSGEFATPVSLAVAGVVLALSALSFWRLAANERTWIRVMRPTVDRASHLSGVRAGIYITAPAALFCFLKAAHLWWAT